jgi:hypothetical protein
MALKIQISKEKIEKAIENTSTMAEAALYFKINFRTFKRMAIEYNLYNPTLNGSNKKMKLEDILNGKYPQYPTSHLSKRLVKECYLEYKCNTCGINDYNHKPITLELNHIDGNNRNHAIDNLELLCPNCHSQTPTYRSKKLKLNKEYGSCRQGGKFALKALGTSGYRFRLLQLPLNGELIVNGEHRKL